MQDGQDDSDASSSGVPAEWNLDYGSTRLHALSMQATARRPELGLDWGEFHSFMVATDGIDARYQPYSADGFPSSPDYLTVTSAAALFVFGFARRLSPAQYWNFAQSFPADLQKHVFLCMMTRASVADVSMLRLRAALCAVGIDLSQECYAESCLPSAGERREERR